MADVPLFIVHVSTKGAMEAVREAYAGGQSVFGETCTHYLVLDTSYLALPDFEGAKYVCAPPLRTKEHQEALWEGIDRGWLNAVSSDHCALDGGFEKKKEGLEDFTKYQMESLAFKTGFQCYGVREWPKGVYLNSGLWI